MPDEESRARARETYAKKALGEEISEIDRTEAELRLMLYGVMAKFAGDDESLKRIAGLCNEIVHLCEAKGLEVPKLR